MTTVVITGASAGVGRAVARRFGADGASVGLIARGEERLNAAVCEIEDTGGRALALPCDVADAAAVEAAAAAAEDRLGEIDIWINAAMVTVLSPVHRMSPEEIRRVTEVTYLGSVHGTLAALRRMRARDRGTIVQVGSALAYRSIPLQSAYCAAKHAIVGFTDSLRSELIHDRSGVRLSVVQLPAVNTPQFVWMRNRMPRRPQPLPPIYQPEVAAEAIHFAALHPRRELWVGGSAWKAILGQRLAPGAMDAYLARAAWDGQMTREPAGGTPDNLFESVAGDIGAHGPFDARATRHSPMLAASEHRTATVLATGAAVLAVGLALHGRRR
jgi:NAD(P)-dependent dehydrogenase (short-subunit alcohol dehydrogenase family)